MSFARDANNYPINTFGLLPTDSGLMTFGKEASPSSTLPSGVVYQQLLHPSDSTQTITSIVAACNFLGKAFVVVLWSDNNQFAYYNGKLIGSTRNGLVMEAASGVLETISNLASDLAAQINGILDGWVAYSNQTVAGGVGVARAGSCIITSPVGVHFTPIPSVVTTATGIVAAKLIDQNLAGTPAIAAAVAFTLTSSGAPNGTVQLTGPSSATDASNSAQITGGQVNFNTSLAQTAQDVVTAVNLFSGTTGYHASVNGTTVTVYAPVQFGNFGGFAANNLVVDTTGTLTTTAGTATSQFFFTYAPNPAKKILTISPSTSPAIVDLGVQIYTNGALGSASYTWQECNADGSVPVVKASGITFTPDQQSGASCHFSFTATLPSGGHWAVGTASVMGYFKVVGTDSGGAFGSPATKVIAVTLGFNVP